MKKEMSKSNEQGFTLVELIVSIFTLGILGLGIYVMILIAMALMKYIG